MGVLDSAERILPVILTVFQVVLHDERDDHRSTYSGCCFLCVERKLRYSCHDIPEHILLSGIAGWFRVHKLVNVVHFIKLLHHFVNKSLGSYAVQVF